MGHELARPTAAAAVALCLLGAACGGGDGGDPPPVLDNARDLVVEATSPTAPDTTVADAEELPAPDPSTFEGENRVVNLWVGADGETSPVDVWGRRTFTNGPILLAEGVRYGAASDYFSAPPGYSIVVVNAGAGPDGDERAGVFNAGAGERITTVFTNDDDAGAVSAPTYYEGGSSQAPDPPAAESGLIRLAAPNVRAFSETMTEALGGDAFYVGDGSEVCRPQRVEADGFAPNILGGTQTVELDVPPGDALITFHPWFSADECAQPSVGQVTVPVSGGSTSFVIVYTQDGSTIDTLVLPVS